MSLFSRRVKVKLAFAFLGSLLVSLADVVGILSIGALMLLITGISVGDGLLGTASQILGITDRGDLTMFLAVVVFATFLAKSLAGIAVRWWMMGMLARQEVELSTEILTYYLRMPYVRHVERGAADLIRSMNDAVAQFYGSVVLGVLSAATELITMTTLVLVLAVAAPLPTLVLALYFGIAAMAFRIYARGRLIALGEQMLELSRRIYMAAFHALGGIKEIKLRHSGAHFLKEYEESRLEAANVRRSASLYHELPKSLLEVMFVLGISVMTVAIFLQQSGASALGLLTMFIAAGFRLLPSVVRLLASINAVTSGQASIELVLREVTEARSLPGSASTDLRPALSRMPFTREICYDHVSFRYPTSPGDVIRNVCLTMPVGTSTALVGASGSGKSTMVDLLLGLHTPQSGAITVDGRDVAQDLAGWQANLAVVPQDVYVMEMPLRENIAFGVPRDEISDDRVTMVVRQAEFADVVRDMPNGLNTSAGDLGKRLSGGQRQRMGIARALYSEPSVLVLDEATSALDNETERRISDAIHALHGQVTVVIVAHRLSTVKDCDQIAYMDDGRILDCADFATLQARNAGFARLVELGTLDARPPVGDPAPSPIV